MHKYGINRPTVCRDFRLVRHPRLNRQAIAYLILGVTVFFAIFPVFWVASIAFKGQQEWFARPLHWLPSMPTLVNFVAAFSNRNGANAVLNSLMAAAGGTLVALLVGYPAAYAMSRYRTRKLPLFIVPLILRATPPVVIAVPLLLFYSPLGLVDTVAGLIPVYAATTVFYIIWLIKPFIDAVPREIEEAAMADGVRHWRIPFSVVLPIVSGGLAAATTFVFILNWTEFSIALTLTRLYAETIPVQMTTLTSLYSVLGNGQSAALSTASMIPFLFIAYYLQKLLLRSFFVGAVRGE